MEKITIGKNIMTIYSLSRIYILLVGALEFIKATKGVYTGYNKLQIFKR